MRFANAHRWFHLQRTAGNTAVVGLLAGSASPVVQRDDAPVEAAATPVSFDPHSLEMEAEIGGHALAPLQRDGPATAPPKVVNTAVTVGAPTVVARPGAAIASSHGRPGVAAWTTPAYNVTVPHIDSRRIDVATSINFNIEADSTYTGGRGEVLMEHEQGHVRIGTDVGQKAFGGDLRTALEALPNFSSATAVRGALTAAVTSFTTTEGANSLSFDNSDYPRMLEAYYGVRHSLGTLSAGSPRIAALVNAMRRVVWLPGIRGARASAVVSRLQQLIDRSDGLTEQDIQRLQYNAEFKALVARVRTAATSVTTTYASTAAVGERVAVLDVVLQDYAWSSEQALRNIGVVD